MCVIAVSLALCDNICLYLDADIPAGCLKIYPFTSDEIHCPESSGVLGSCGKVEMLKIEGKDGSKVDKRICENCVAWSALMRDKDGNKAKRTVVRSRAESHVGQESLDSDSEEAIMTPGNTSDSSEFGMEIDN